MKIFIAGNAFFNSKHMNNCYNKYLKHRLLTYFEIFTYQKKQFNFIKNENRKTKTSKSPGSN
jgi:hypothetical protein